MRTIVRLRPGPCLSAPCEGSGRGRLLVEIEHRPPAGQPSPGLPGKDPEIPAARTEAGSFPLVNHLKSKARHSQIGDRINLVIEFVVRDDPGGLAEIHEPGDERVAACGSTRETRKHNGDLRMDEPPHVLGATLEPRLIDRAESLGHSFGICWHDSRSPLLRNSWTGLAGTGWIGLISQGLLRLIHRARFLGGIAPPLSSRLSCRYAAAQGDLGPTLERTVCDAGSGVSEWRDHAGGGGQGPGLGPGFRVRRLGLRGLPDVPGPVLAGGGAPGAAQAKSRRAGFRASR